MVDMRHTVVELGEFTRVPTVSGTHEIARDTLQFVDVRRTALRAFLQMVVCILIAAVHAAVAVVVDGAVAHVELIHHIHHAHDDLRVMGGITVDLHVEDMSATRQVVIRCLDLSLMTSRALVIHGHVVGVGIVVAIGDTRDDAKLLAILLRELATKTLGGGGQHGVVVVIAVAELVDTVAHVGDDLQTKFLRLGTLAMMLARKSHQTLCQTDEADT